MYITDQISHYTYINIRTKDGEEIVKTKLKELKPTWTHHVCKKIQIAVDKDCFIKINGEDELLIKSKYGLIIDYSDKDIMSLTTLTEGVNLYAIIGY